MRLIVLAFLCVCVCMCVRARARAPHVKGTMVVHAVASAQWEFLAVLPLFDPPRHDTRETVARCLAKGIAVKMITGDQLAIGQETARQLGMGDMMHTSSELTEVTYSLP